MVKYIKATEETDAIIREKLDNLEDKFEYAIGGIEKLVLDGDSNTAFDVISTLNTAIESVISDLSSYIEI